MVLRNQTPHDFYWKIEVSRTIVVAHFNADVNNISIILLFPCWYSPTTLTADNIKKKFDMWETIHSIALIIFFLFISECPYENKRKKKII